MFYAIDLLFFMHYYYFSYFFKRNEDYSRKSIVIHENKSK